MIANVTEDFYSVIVSRKYIFDHFMNFNNGTARQPIGRAKFDLKILQPKYSSVCVLCKFFEIKNALKRILL